MKTPIYDFVRRYSEAGSARFHMPGHKGRGFLGAESGDITEISGADVLYGADGIIAESEENATALFGSAHTFYSAEGSTLAIKAMLALAAYDCDSGSKLSGTAERGVREKACTEKRRKRVVAARNVHKAFVYACALLDLDVEWLCGDGFTHLCRSEVSAETVAETLARLRAAGELPCAVYITSPDYLGNIADIRGISRACREYGVPLLVDNAHGAYLAFTEPNLHPLALGADMCCDSAHKTLPVLTGGAYLHVAKHASAEFIKNARARLSLFASTSPSYLILQSLDMCNRYLSEGYRERLSKTVRRVVCLKERMSEIGYITTGDEPMKITVDAVKSGISGERLGDELRKCGVEPEFCDGEFLVLMPSTENTEKDFLMLERALVDVCREECPINLDEILPSKPITVMTVREAVLSPHETVPLTEAAGRICGSPTVSCPPAVPIAVSGELITPECVSLFRKYGIRTVDVVKTAGN